MRILSLVILVVLCENSATWAGDGVVALQTADPSCPDDSSDRYVDCGNGTVTDNDTGPVWLKQANCLAQCSVNAVPCTVDSNCTAFQTCNPTVVDWYTAMEFVAGLSDKPATSAAAAHDCGLSDGSSSGEWRLPSVEEWEAMIAEAVALGCVLGNFGGPSITNDSGASCWREGPGNSFTGVVDDIYWTSTTDVILPNLAWFVSVHFGLVSGFGKSSTFYVWPVRGGQ